MKFARREKVTIGHQVWLIRLTFSRQLRDQYWQKAQARLLFSFSFKSTYSVTRISWAMGTKFYCGSSYSLSLSLLGNIYTDPTWIKLKHLLFTLTSQYASKLLLFSSVRYSLWSAYKLYQGKLWWSKILFFKIIISCTFYFTLILLSLLKSFFSSDKAFLHVFNGFLQSEFQMKQLLYITECFFISKNLFVKYLQK